MDFARLEEIFLEKLRASGIPRFTSSIRALLVDEYQDTNPLQEAIYFKIVGIATASLTVVGDDDQSLYRFRGATVELFRDFRNRFNSELPTMSQPVLRYLIDNYRSTPEIVAFFNNFVGNDPAFAQARVQPLKPLILAQLGSNGIPVLGMFRSDVQTLARDLSQFLNDVFRGNGRTLQVSGSPATIIADPNGGDFGDAVILGHTVNEYGARWMNNPPKERLPKLLRDEFAAMGVAIFNPRGRQLRDIPVVQQLLGVMLECIDPPTLTASNGRIQEQMATPPAPARPSLRSEARIYLQEWRLAARQLIASNPLPRQNHTLQDFVRAWQTRRTQTGEPWPDEWPVLELCFKLLSWFPLLRDDPEGQVYLEAVTRCIAQAATYSSYRSHIINGHPIHADGSIRRAIGDIFAPMAEGAIDVEEDIMPSVPRSRLTFMTIHQAKGLEYPLVIVDVASDYTKDAPANRFRRFPEKASSIQMLEDDLAPYCNVGPLRTARPALARSFDDLIRLYYVAYSRPQSALMLVGLDTCLRYKATIKHLALGWRADQTWSWRSPVAATGRRGQRFPPMANNIPLTLV
jgi:DNA helicase-2/ATP-dependent DNA helicase PcrA